MTSRTAAVRTISEIFILILLSERPIALTPDSVMPDGRSDKKISACATSAAQAETA